MDETMIGFKGRLSFIQYMPQKTTKWGMKAFVLADSCTGYMYNWHLYTDTHKMYYLTTHYVNIYMYITNPGKDDSLDSGELGMTAAVVLRLVQPICGRGHHIYFDNLYTSPTLFTRLQSQGFAACGTLRLNRRGVPPEAKMRIERGGSAWFLWTRACMWYSGATRGLYLYSPQSTTTRQCQYSGDLDMLLMDRRLLRSPML